jgi:hypothetical protein
MKNKIMVLYTVVISSILFVSVATLEPKANIDGASPSPPEPVTGDNKLVLGQVTIPLDKDTKLSLETADSKISINPK